MNKREILRSICFTLLVILTINYSGYSQAKNKVTIIVKKEYNSEIRDTAWFDYQSDLKNSRNKIIPILYSAKSPASFSFNLTGPIGIIKVFVKGESIRALPSTYVEGGDTILIKITGKGKETKAFFVGKKASKFQLQWQLDSISFWGQYPVNHSKIEKGKPINLQTFYYRCGLVRDDKIRFLNAIKTVLSPNMYHLYKADIDGRFISNTSATSLSFLTESNFESELFPVIKELLNKPIDTTEKGAKLSSLEFLKGLNNRVKLEFALNNLKKPGMLEVYNALKNQLSGVWREEVIYNFIKNVPYGRPEDFTASAEDALNIIKDSEDRKFIVDLLQARGMGSKAYNFSLLNSDRREVHLSDFKGKTIVLDFWFTGCPGCLGLSKVMEKEVLPLFKDRIDFVYVTINIDKNADIWKNSIASLKYTRPEYINLNTGSEGITHSVINQYQVKSYPTIIIINKAGKIVSSNIKRQGGTDIIKYIKEAL